MAKLVTPRNEKWDMRMLGVAKTVASWSKDPSTQTGAVITDWQHRILSVGYNGFPFGVDDSPERYADRELKYQIIVHCERNAMLCERSLADCTLYTWPFMSCAPCAAMVIQTGIRRCVAPVNDNPRWKDSFRLTEMLFREGGVELDLYEVEL